MSEGSHLPTTVRERAVEAARNGIPKSIVAQAYGVSRLTIYRWLDRFAQDGSDGLERKPGSGRPRKLTELDGRQLWKIVLQPATRFGYETDLWTVTRVHQVVQEKLEVAVSQDTIWRRLREAGLTYQKPERQYFQTDHGARLEWLTCELPKIRETVRKYGALLYFQDEANVSLTAFLGKTWAPRGETQSAGQRTTRRSCRPFGNQPTWPSVIRLVRETDYLG